MRVESDGDINAEHMWEQMKRAMVESTREVCGSVRGGTPSVWWNDVVKAAVEKGGCLEGSAGS